ncbi:MAG: CDP-glucose 4,6-dehydratase [Alphaproteobacteria bacterium]|nr:CDP-glucose 4,6-dehydratase [Alphaproteobacteria bacterium]
MQTNGLDLAFWRNRRVFITGHTGFMGSWLSLWLHQLGAEVAGYALSPPTQPSLFDVLGLENHMVSTIGDIQNLPQLRASMNEFAPDIVFHLAAQPIVSKGYIDPVGTFGTNIMGTVNLLQSMRTAPSIKTALIVTTDKVYENQEWAWGYRESDPLGGHEPYGASKACAELAANAFRHSYFSEDEQVGIATIRAGNIIGGGDWATNRIIPDAIRAFSNGNPLSIRNPAATRPWQHVLEPLRGYMQLAQSLHLDPENFDGPWNFGPSEEDSAPVSVVAEEMTTLWGGGASWNSAMAPADMEGTKESQRLTLSSSKAHEILGWRPVWGLQRALSSTVAWYKAYLDRQNMVDFSLEQIALADGAN